MGVSVVHELRWHLFDNASTCTCAEIGDIGGPVNAGANFFLSVVTVGPFLPGSSHRKAGLLDCVQMSLSVLGCLMCLVVPHVPKLNGMQALLYSE